MAAVLCLFGVIDVVRVVGGVGGVSALGWWFGSGCLMQTPTNNMQATPPPLPHP
jgi:hypothetical protein